MSIENPEIESLERQATEQPEDLRYLEKEVRTEFEQKIWEQEHRESQLLTDEAYGNNPIVGLKNFIHRVREFLAKITKSQ
jgi:hypothetical protein